MRPRIGQNTGTPRIVPLCGVLILAAALRLWHYDFDPNANHIPLFSDADKKLAQVQAVLDGRFEPERYYQPYFLIYSTAGVLKAASWLGFDDFAAQWRLIALLTIACSVASVGLLYAMARVVFDDQVTPLFAALLLAVVPINVMGSRYFKEDIPLMLLTNVALFLILLLVTSRKPVFYVTSGLAMGVAVATKYSAVLLLVPFLAAHAVNVARAERGTRCRAGFHPLFFAGLTAALLGFLLFNPCMLVDGGRALKHLLRQTNKMGEVTAESIPFGRYGGLFYLRHALAPGLTWPVVACALVGLPVLLVARNLPGAFVGLWVLVYYLAMEAVPAKPFPFLGRYLHALTPGGCLLAAATLRALLMRSRSATPGRWAILALAGLCVALPLSKTLLVNASLKRDTRTVASQWINTHLTKGARIFLDTPVYSPRPDEAKFNVRYQRRFYFLSFDDLDEEEVDYVVLNSFKCDRFDYTYSFSELAGHIREYYREFEDRYDLVKKFEPRFRCQTYAFHNPRIRIYRRRGTPRPEPRSSRDTRESPRMTL